MSAAPRPRPAGIPAASAAVVGFFAALVPLAGVLIMLGLWWRAGAALPDDTPENKEPLA